MSVDDEDYVDLEDDAPAFVFSEGVRGLQALKTDELSAVLDEAVAEGDVERVEFVHEELVRRMRLSAVKLTARKAG